MKFTKIVKKMEKIMGQSKFDGEKILEVFSDYTNNKRILKKFNNVSDKDFRDEIGTEKWNGMRAFVFFYHKELDKDMIAEMYNTLNEDEQCIFTAHVIKHIISDEIEKVYLTGTKTFKKNVEKFVEVDELLKSFEMTIEEGNRQYYN